MADLGRISGPMLKDNLVRNGVDLVFENEFGDNNLFLDVNAKRIGINTDSLSRELIINDSAKTTNLIVDNSAVIDLLEINGSSNTISNLLGDVFLGTDLDTVFLPRLETDSLIFDDNYIASKLSNAAIELKPIGTGRVTIESDLFVTGNLHTVGDITLGGNITFGNDDSDSVTFNTDVNTNIVPDQTDLYDLGKIDKQWKELRAKLINGEFLVADNFAVEDVTDIALRPGNTWFVATNGTDTNVGDHENGPFASIEKALSVAQSGDTVKIYPGEYEEVFPLIVPQGVSVNGSGIRAVTVKPTAGTKDLDAFLLNGETTISDLTVTDYFYNNTNNTGYAFRFANNFEVTSRSPYIQNITVITREVVGTLSPTPIIVGPGTTGYSPTSDSVTLYKSSYSQELVDSLVGQTAVIDRYPNPPLIYTVISIVTDPVSPTEWRMTVDAPFNPAGQFKSITFYPDANAIELITNDIWDTTGNSIGEKWVAWFKTNLPVNFETTVQPGWTINVAGTLYIVDYIIEDPINTNQWRIYVTTSLVAGVGIPIFSSPTGSAAQLAGRGALVDGSVATAASKEASMLFHSMTMIIPNSIGVYMTNGVRVEWLNSFTYFASKGLYATNGSLGRFDGTTTKYGAELRSIGSANVYGTVGAEVDGDQTLMYLINHNFAYIGTGTEPINDPTTVIQENETVTLNSGKIYWQSLDQRGDFRIGEAFVVDQETGFVILNGFGQGPGGINNITLSDGTSVTELTALKVETGNIRFSDNTISSNDGPVTFDSFTTDIELDQDVTISENLEISGEFVIKGTATIGDAIIDRVAFAADISSNIIPIDDKVYNLGADPLQWNNLFVNDVLLLDINVDDNRIFTTNSDSNLQLLAAGTGSVEFVSNVEITNDLTVNGTANLLDTTVFGSINHTGSTSQVGDTVLNGDFDINGLIQLNNPTISFSNIQISENRILTTESNSDLELKAAGTARILIPKNNVLIENNLTVDTINSNDITVVNTLTVGSLFNENIRIQGNLIETTQSNSDLELDAAGSGNIVFKSDSIVDTNLTAQSSVFLTRSSLADLALDINTNIEVQNTLNQPITQVGDRNQTGNFVLTGELTNDSVPIVNFENIRIQSDRITTTNSNSDLELRAAGSGVVRIPTEVNLLEDLTVIDTIYLDNVSADRIIGNLLSNGNIVVGGNVIKTTISNSDLELRANGAGIILIPANDAQITNDLTVLGDVTVNDTNLGDVNQNGSLTRVGTSQQTGTYSIVGDLIASSEARFDNINFVDSRIATTNSQSDLELAAAGSGKVIFDEELTITESLLVGNTLTVGRIAVQTTTDGDSLFNDVIRIKDNFIETTISNANLHLVGNNTGGVLFETLLFKDNSITPTSTNTGINLNLINSNILINGTTAVKIPVGTTAQRVTGLTGDLRFNTSNNLFEGWNIGRKPLSGIFSNNLQTSVRASDTSNVINFVANGIPSMEITTTKLRTNGLRIDNNLLIDGNTFSTLSNTDINITPSGTGIVVMGDTTVTGNEFLNLSTTQPMSFAHTGFGYLKFNSTTSVVIPVGDNTNRPTSPEVGDLRFNTDLSIPEVFNGIAYSTLAGDTVNATIEQIQELNEIYAILLG